MTDIFSEGTSTTTLQEFKFQYTFIIADILMVVPFLSSGGRIDSDVFSVDPNNEVWIKFGVKENTYQEYPNAYMFFDKQEAQYVLIKESKCSHMHENMTLSQYRFKEEQLFVKNVQNVLEIDIDELRYDIYSDAESRETSNERFSQAYLTDGNLVLLFTGTISIPSKNNYRKSKENENYVTSLPLDLEKLWDNRQFSDVDLSCDGQNFPAHRSILWARSKVFAEMLVPKKENAENNIITIEDTSSEVCQEGLYFIYTGKYPKLKIMATELLVFAKKYGVPDLTSVCETELTSSISVENVCNLFSLAEEQDASILHGACLKFIKDNSKLVMGTPDWKVLRKNYPDVVSEILEYMVLG